MQKKEADLNLNIKGKANKTMNEKELIPIIKVIKIFI